MSAKNAFATAGAVQGTPSSPTMLGTGAANSGAWGAASIEATTADTMTEIRLAKGARLHLIVEDPDGVPLAGVEVRSAPTAKGGAPDPDDPDAPATWRTGENGVLVVDDLPARAIDLHLHREGYADEVVADVTPGDVTWFATLVEKR